MTTRRTKNKMEKETKKTRTAQQLRDTLDCMMMGYTNNRTVVGNWWEYINAIVEMEKIESKEVKA